MLNLTVKSSSHIIVCCSGGADSMALLYMCRQFALDNNCSISAFHAKHGLSANQHDWANFVQSECEKLSIPIHIVEVNPNCKPLSETEARRLRYSALNQYIATIDNKNMVVVTGHHKNDRMENYLISVFKNRTHNFDLVNHQQGNVSFQKPLLGYSKNELIQYCQIHNISFVHDESNDVSDNLRNIIRNQLFKYIDKLKHKAQYMVSLERFFDNYKTFNEFYMASVRQFISKMQIKAILDKSQSNSVQPSNNEHLEHGFALLEQAGVIALRYSCTIDELKNAAHGKHIEFAAHLVQLLYNDYCLHLSSVKKQNGNHQVQKVLNCFNFQNFVQFFPFLERNQKQYKVDDFMLIWVKDGRLFIKIQAVE